MYNVQSYIFDVLLFIYFYFFWSQKGARAPLNPPLISDWLYTPMKSVHVLKRSWQNFGVGWIFTACSRLDMKLKTSYRVRVWKSNYCSFSPRINREKHNRMNRNLNGNRHMMLYGLAILGMFRRRSIINHKFRVTCGIYIWQP